ncbi:hypothetical protein L6452_34623 [Arctium lappa]|uniref:Uncharacterized protein n=1 Tax=Arctium lappa TaxID=4217 RepID=A0ACB8YJG1_ARCLA|nr:hypothetical protein L6452_34623 [Arctium lappa]
MENQTGMAFLPTTGLTSLLPLHVQPYREYAHLHINNVRWRKTETTEASKQSKRVVCFLIQILVAFIFKGKNLIGSGEKERLKELLGERLTECGWKDEMKSLCRPFPISGDPLEHNTTKHLRHLFPCATT